jgi:hypothetical protein
MGIIDEKEMKIDYQIPQDYEQSERKTWHFYGSRMKGALTASSPLVAFNSPHHF